MSAPTPAPSAGGDNLMMKAVGVGFLALILLNGQLSSNLQFAIVIAIIAYFLMKPKKEAAH